MLPLSFRPSFGGKAPFISPSDLRKASLRDFPHTLDSAGFSAGGERDFEWAVELTRVALTRNPPAQEP